MAGSAKPDGGDYVSETVKIRGNQVRRHCGRGLPARNRRLSLIDSRHHHHHYNRRSSAAYGDGDPGIRDHRRPCPNAAGASNGHDGREHYLPQEYGDDSEMVPIRSRGANNELSGSGWIRP